MAADGVIGCILALVASLVVIAVFIVLTDWRD